MQQSRGAFIPLLRPLGVALAICVAPLPAHAAILFVDSAFGPGTVTRDTGAGLEWLDFQFTFGSVAEIDATLAPGEALEGWRRASTAEITTFWANAGVLVTDSGEPAVGTVDALQIASTSALMELVGFSHDGGGSFDFSTGYTAEAALDPDQFGAAYLMREFGDTDFIRSAAVIDVTRSATLSVGDALPSWLVRDIAAPVAEPATLGLLGLGLAAMAFGRRRG